MSVHDVLSESIALIADNSDDVVRAFYRRLFVLAPGIEAMFPPDLLTANTHQEGSAGARQRDQLVGALVKVAELFGAGDREEQELDTILRMAGRSHSAFRFPGEAVPRPARAAEYALVKRALFETLGEVAGDRWKPEYTEAWDQAYDYAAVEMQHASQHEGRSMLTARTARRVREQ
jgi:hemoglobin-like flavoprotein